MFAPRSKGHLKQESPVSSKAWFLLVLPVSVVGGKCNDAYQLYCIDLKLSLALRKVQIERKQK